MRINRTTTAVLIALLTTVFLSFSLPAAPGGDDKAVAKKKRPLTLRDLMTFRALEDPKISEDGKWTAYIEQPDRGNSELVVINTAAPQPPFKRIPRGIKPNISKDGRWVGALIAPDAVEAERHKNREKTGSKNGGGKNGKLKNDMVLLDTASGEAVFFDRVKTFAFSSDSQWLLVQCAPEEKKKDTDAAPEPPDEGGAAGEKDQAAEDKWEKKAYPLVLRHLPSGADIHIPRVIYYAFDPSVRYLVYSLFKSNGNGNGLFLRDLKKTGAPERKLHKEHDALYTNLAFSKTHSRLGFIFHRNRKKSASQKTFASGLWVWDGVKNKLYCIVTKDQIPKGWMIPAENKLQWTDDGERMFFGFKPYGEYIHTLADETKKNNADDTAEKINLFAIDEILKKRGVDVWHWKDPRIIPNQKKRWEQYRKRIYRAVFHFKSKQFVPLCDTFMPEIRIPLNPRVAIGFSNRPYLRELTWDGRYRDVYVSNMTNGFRQKILTRHAFDASLSPGGRFVAYYKDKHWHLYDVRLKYARRLTGGIKTPFYDEDNDYPSEPRGYGMAGWTEKDRSVIIYDKYDIWEFFTASDSGKHICLTGGTGRENERLYRIKKTDPEFKFFKKRDTCLVSAYSDREKTTAFYRVTLGKTGVEKLLDENKKLTFLQKAKTSGAILYTRESFREFPDLRISDPAFTASVRLTDVNPQRKEFLWGNAELIRWKSLDGTPLEGVVIKPENYDPSRRYPVLVYYYRFFSQRLHQFNPVVINHRPCFPYYASHDYVVFLPDIRFDVGHPGNAAFRCVVSGVQALIDRGVADPKAVGLHGHSWSGYQTAFIVTQTDMFAAAVAGAPVSNMTSAYGGIRWGSGLARMFQYEKSQSRIGKTLWEAPELYIENSPIFFAHRIQTPLLIQFGDKDEAVPWYQGIELYLALRRLDKNCIFLQYNDEPHHLKKYANKVDYTIKMKQYFDHYLRGKPAPGWITQGVPYRKK